MSKPRIGRWKWAVIVLILFIAGAAIASDPLDGAKDFSAIGVGQLTPGICLGTFTLTGTLRGEPVGKAEYTLLVGNPTQPSPCAANKGGGGGVIGALTLTTNDHSVLVTDISLSTPDGGETYNGTFSAPNNLSGPGGSSITSATSTGKFQGVFGSGMIVVGSGTNPNTATQQNESTLHLNGTLVFPD